MAAVGPGAIGQRQCRRLPRQVADVADGDRLGTGAGYRNDRHGVVIAGAGWNDVHLIPPSADPLEQVDEPHRWAAEQPSCPGPCGCRSAATLVYSHTLFGR